MTSASYLTRRSELETYFDETASAAWEKLTSDAPVSGIRATVRAGRDAVRGTLLDWLDMDLSGRRLLDAGCGAGQFSVAAARRGASVVAVDLAGTLVGLAEKRLAELGLTEAVDFRVGDMFDERLGDFDHIVAMDSVIHYEAPDMAAILAGFAARARKSVLFTFAPRTPALSLKLAAGALFPRSDRSPAIRPVSEATLSRLIAAEASLADWTIGRTHRVSTGFYTSQAMELVRR